METLVPWKCKRDKYRDEADDDALGVRGPKLTDTMQEAKFIIRDSANADVMKKLNSSWWR